MFGWMVGWLDGWLVGWMNGWMVAVPDGPSSLHLVVLHQVLHVEVFVAAQHAPAKKKHLDILIQATKRAIRIRI